MEYNIIPFRVILYMLRFGGSTETKSLCFRFLQISIVSIVQKHQHTHKYSENNTNSITNYITRKIVIKDNFIIYFYLIKVKKFCAV